MGGSNSPFLCGREQVSAQIDQRFRSRKLIFKMAAVAAILDFRSNSRGWNSPFLKCSQYCYGTSII